MKPITTSIAVGAACCLVACASKQGEALRPQLAAWKAPSVAEWEGGEARLRSATMRVGVLLPDGAEAYGVPVRLQRDGAAEVEHFEFFNEASGAGRTRIGAAVPVTSDGYFLTARHCLGAGSPAVFIHDRSTNRLIKSLATVVWTSGAEADLALLRTSHRIREPFELAEVVSLAKGDRVGATGWSGLGERGVFGGMAAGRVRSVAPTPAKRPGEFSWWRVGHDVPIQPGDSGGPLVDSSGRLVGINSGGKVGAIAIYEKKSEGAPLRGFRASSNLPDGEWLRARIEEDRDRGS